MEKTLIILKPDCMLARKAGATLSRFEQAGFDILAAKIMQLEDALLKEHYAHLADKPFFPEITEFMSSAPVLVVVLGGPNAIDRVRTLLGPTDPNAAAAGTIRGDWGTTKMKNIAHASDSTENAEAEIQRFFPELR